MPRCHSTISALLLAFSMASILSPIVRAAEREYFCKAENAVHVERHRLTQYLSDNGIPMASWGQEYEPGKFASCGFADGRKILLTDLNLWPNKDLNVDQGVWIYRGMGNHCSAGHLLFFNELKEFVLILDVHTMGTDEYICATPN